MEWISVEDRLPEIGREVIVYRPYKDVGKQITALCRYIRYEEATDYFWDNNYPGSGENIHTMSARITHWMPLPDPPKE